MVLRLTLSQPGNSGGPILDALTDKAIGIHTTSGCDQGGGTNSGTRIDVPEVMQHISFLINTSSPTGKPTTKRPSAKPTSKRASPSHHKLEIATIAASSANNEVE